MNKLAFSTVFSTLKTMARPGAPVAPHIARNLCAAANASTDASTKYNFKTLKLTTPSPFVVHVEFNRPDRMNAFNRQLWTEIKDCFDQLHNDPDCRVVVLSGGSSKHFTAGIDLFDMMKLGQEMGAIEEVGRRGRLLEGTIKLYQDCISSLEHCYKPVIVAVHSACIGAGLNLITAADVRYCTRDAWFSLKEVDIGLAADVGALQRFPRVVGNQSWVRELAFTARKFASDEAHSHGLVSRLFDNREELLQGAIKLAEEIASKSPIAVQGTKKNIVYSADHTVQEGLDHIRAINMLNLQSEDFLNAIMASQSKETPVFAKL
ncbi:delta(3,5)-Delta(2,4)-dienoyl-CoA isomerase, mitochondrial [Anopheles merus]|uniref:Delta(3,5)-Delta(2,4)-dienoyl-CoA isomerase, mitochondrial n=1 Tax=Anopheles merus TaxID=30066 RepID=A0A182V0H8_ANOME|nr:delta(3,5)-Delta(2,4)-dienoyl-CoA isomerase, mitochondrial [Anopheles merus]